MKQKEDIIQEGASALFNSENQTEPDNSRIHSQRKFFLTGRRGAEQKGGDKGEIRTSFMLNRKQYDKVREIAMREGMTIKDLVYYMLELAIDKYESKHGKVVVSREDKAKNLFI